MTRLAAAVSDALSQYFLDVDVETDVANGRLLAYLAKNGEILSRTYSEQRVSVHCRIPRNISARLRPRMDASTFAALAMTWHATATRSATGIR